MQVLVIGAGVIGLAIARTAAQAGHDVTVAEMTGGIANGVSSRNSEVIHAGLYYPTDSLRARHCVRGRRMLYAFCGSHDVPHRKSGKLVVATSPAELAKVETIHTQAQINGVEGTEMIGANAARAMESELSCIGALWSPETGIIDSHAFMRALWGELEDCGGSDRVRNSGGASELQGAALARAIRRPRTLHFWNSTPPSMPRDWARRHWRAASKAIRPSKVPRLVLGKGNYFGMAGRPVFSRLIYPTPIDGGLGVHVTLDMAGRMRFGPDVEWVSEENYAVDPRRADSFYSRIRTYWPDLPDGSLVPDYSGIRPKLRVPANRKPIS